MFSEGGNGAGDQGSITLPIAQLVDELVLRYNRADGTLGISGHVVNNEVALEILLRAARHYETILRLEAAARIREQAIDAGRTAEILARTRGGRQ